VEDHEIPPSRFPVPIQSTGLKQWAAIMQPNAAFYAMLFAWN
jgi:hypothetical protein